jgi:hypothetical protein
MEICIVTSDIRKTLEGLVKHGRGPFRIFSFNPGNVTEQTIRDKPTAFELKVAFTTQGIMI